MDPNGPPTEKIKAQSEDQALTLLSIGHATDGNSLPNFVATQYSQQLRRRRRESWRVVPLESGHAAGLADPWHYSPPTAGYEDAAMHLRSLGLTPAPNREGLRLMWKRGGHSRQAAEMIADRWEMDA